MNISRLKFGLIVLGLVCSFVASADDEKQLSIEEDKQASTEASETISEEEQIKQEQIKQEKTKTISNDQVFIPTEEISEDKPVLFPVDI